MDTLLLYPIFLPLVAGLVCLLLPRRARVLREILAVAASAATLGLVIAAASRVGLSYDRPWVKLSPGLEIGFNLLVTPYGRLILIPAAAFALLVAIYSLRYMENLPRHAEFYAYLLWAIGLTVAAILADNLILLLFFWDLIGVLLFLMIMIAGDEATASATKTLIIAGTADLMMLLAVSIYWIAYGSTNPGLSISVLMANPVHLNSWTAAVIFILMLAGGFAKGGVIPLHTWIPAISTHAPLPVMGYFTALDKLTGFYLIARIALDWFVMTPASGIALMVIGTIAILGGVLMAMIQHDARRMLAFHSISQVGYMVLGIGTGTTVGVIGGLFHMLNMAVLKGNLFLCVGSVRKQTGTSEFAELGGLARAMPWTFASTLIASLGIAGIPPLNAFVSKWLVYQGILQHGGIAFPVFLLVAMFGSSLTLASFMKLMYSFFWGDQPADLYRVRESPVPMRITMVTLALVSVLTGLFYQWPLRTLLLPVLGDRMPEMAVGGLWQSELAAVLLVLSLLAGAILYWISRPRESREADVFLGGEAMDLSQYRVPGTHFYGPVKNFPGLRQMFELAEKGTFDIYQHATSLVNWFSWLVYKYIDQSLSDFYQEVIPSVLSLIGQIMRLLNARLVLTYLIWLLYAVSFVGVAFFPNADVLFYARLVACVGMVGWAILAAVENDLNRLLVLAATSQLGFVLLGFTLSTSIARLYFITESIAFVLLYLSARSIVRQMHTSLMTQLDGVASRLPLQFLVFMVAGLWMTGLPPFGSFISKFLLGMAAGEISPALGIVITGTAILTLAYLLRPIRHFLRTTRKEVAIQTGAD